MDSNRYGQWAKSGSLDADALSKLRSLLPELAREASASLSAGDASGARRLLAVLAEVGC